MRKGVLLLLLFVCVVQGLIKKSNVANCKKGEEGTEATTKKVTTEERTKKPPDESDRDTEQLALSVRDGVKLALKQCRKLFKFRKWNCAIPLPKEKTSKLPVTLSTSTEYATREGAFLNSIIAAGVIYAITRDCRDAKFKECIAHKRHIPPFTTDDKTWTGDLCEWDFHFGLRKAKPFLTLKRTGWSDRQLLISKNYGVGAKVVRKALRTRCRCHGATKVCPVKACWSKLASFNYVGKFLEDKFWRAKMVRLTKNRPYFQEKVQEGYKPIRRDDQNLLFTKSSPSYCQRNLTIGASGVLGRVCKGKIEHDFEICRINCYSCGLKPLVLKEIRSVKCDCVFVWCCMVKCKSCKKIVSKIKCVQENDSNFPLNGWPAAK